MRVSSASTNNGKPRVRAAVIGHVDSGKSTTAGHLAVAMGAVGPREVEASERWRESRGMSGGRKYALLMDRRRAAREREITTEAAARDVETRARLCTVIDTPGHRDFMGNMISATCLADVALLVVAAPLGEFEAGISMTGLTREHVWLAYTLGVRHMIVLVNKMDDKSVKWSESRYVDVKTIMSTFLEKIGYNPHNISFIPISGWHGDNLVTRSTMAQWYNGPTLMEALDLVEPPTMPIEKPLRISIEGAYMISGVGTVAVGIVESGVLRPGMTITLAPDNITAQVKSIEMNHEPLAEAMPRDDIGFNLKNVEVADIRRGAVTGDADNNPPSSVSSFLARVTVLPHGTSIRPGFSPLIHCHAARFACRFAELQAKIDYHSGKVLQHNPTYIRPGDSAIVLMIPMRPVSVEPFTEHPRLGTIIVHNMSRVVALGTIMSVTKGPCIIASYNKAKGKAKGNRDSNH